ncbi:hypothetical protein ACPOL_6719 [Acidisarcina polymorpha]|uniref:Lipocalin-like domain-containing protein n=1 Tax=Acidisarcina polymorpha TaxID=2211140 RepID=A0A2Z5G9U9_9BACT|nr:hypothetical protein [Acidisarcina polymorpha]AXC15931.1 hypothetical protein ACPOL_6719 [Acidisarcina polymorpha]
MKRRLFFGLLLMALVACHGMCSPPNPDFSGVWKLNGERSTPKRSGNVTLRIDHHDAQLNVETTIRRGSGAARTAMQRYTTDGKVSTTIGADGDEFHTSIVRSGKSLVFSVEEHEDGHIILSRETWTLIENGAALERVREGAKASPDGTGKQILIYLREPPQT